MLQYSDKITTAVTIDLVDADQQDTWLNAQPSLTKEWVTGQQFGSKNPIIMVPGEHGHLAKICVFIDQTSGLWRLGDVAIKAPATISYVLDCQHCYCENVSLAYMAWALGSPQILQIECFCLPD